MLGNTMGGRRGTVSAGRERGEREKEGELGLQKKVKECVKVR